ncbi:lipopolysaccharide biosynthesis protein [Novosphingobium album (ex Liu et al. 2023)]|uniref:Lipopolysaccharide biosynthesis protein n=1 Tax=Novosphingobium album (ex Liu et al. 2023) TaxID=3031130 RepID=A0ABT5WMA3_9SPHN|nr:lipopolysaccharide biosynthesis protein [Novosphingobium album (ex Liu et al. 2023)]MDE8651174.1 lipopolysaccharide biosynthesis protein [Novosphingobium album (ex Liu et al. 2023)]
MSESKSREDIAAIARGGRTNFLGFFLRLAGRIPFLFIAGRAPAYGPAALGVFASALVVIELTAMLCTLGEKRGLAQRLSESEEHPANVVADGMLVAFLVSSVMALVFWFFPAPLFPGGRFGTIDRLMVLAIPSLALTEIWLAALAYRFDIGASVRARAIVEPWTISIMAGAMTFIAPESGLALAYIASTLAAALTAFVPFARSYGLPRGWRPSLKGLGKLTWRSLPIATADAIEWGTRRLDILILGFFAAPSAVGVYYVAQQVASLPQKLKTSFEPILGPVITRNLKTRDYAAIARQVCQVGFWITAAQAGIALALGIPGKGVMGLIGPQFVGGTGALAFLLAAEVAAAPSVVSEAALIYVARMRNVLISILTVGLQALLTMGGILLMQRLGYNELYQAAAAAAALMVSLAFASMVKSWVLGRILAQPITNWRWAVAGAGLPAGLVGWAAIRFLPEWAQLTFGVAAILGVYFTIIWRRGFGPEDRVLFRKSASV